MTQLLFRSPKLESFLAFYRESHDVYEAFVRMSLKMRRKRERYSADAILHAVRWERDLADSTSDWKVNNNFSSWLARLAMARHPVLQGFFELRVADVDLDLLVAACNAIDRERGDA